VNESWPHAWLLDLRLTIPEPPQKIIDKKKTPLRSRSHKSEGRIIMWFWKHMITFWPCSCPVDFANPNRPSLSIPSCSCTLNSYSALFLIPFGWCFCS
jgi:hypothetical protein